MPKLPKNEIMTSLAGLKEWKYNTEKDMLVMECEFKDFVKASSGGGTKFNDESTTFDIIMFAELSNKCTSSNLLNNLCDANTF